MAPRKRGVAFFNLLQKEGVPERKEGGGSLRKGGGGGLGGNPGGNYERITKLWCASLACSREAPTPSKYSKNGIKGNSINVIQRRILGPKKRL